MKLPFVFTVLIVVSLQTGAVSQTQTYRFSGDLEFEALTGEPVFETSFEGFFTLDLNANDLDVSNSTFGVFDASPSSVIFDTGYEDTNAVLLQENNRQNIYFNALNPGNGEYVELTLTVAAMMPDINQPQFLDLSNPAAVGAFSTEYLLDSSSGSLQVAAVPEPCSGMLLIAAIVPVFVKRKRAR